MFIETRKGRSKDVIKFKRWYCIVSLRVSPLPKFIHSLVLCRLAYSAKPLGISAEYCEFYSSPGGNKGHNQIV